MKLFLYSLRTFDELKYCEKYKKEKNIDFAYTTDYPSLDNLYLAKGYDAISMTPCTISDQMLEVLQNLGVKYITCRSIGYDHINLEKAKACGIRISNVTYSPNGVANYTIMLMLMCLRKIPYILKRTELQDYSLKGKLGRDISNCTIGIIGTGKIGAAVIQHLSGFGAKILAYDAYHNPDVAQLAKYVDLDILLQQSDIISLHLNATANNYHLIDETTLKKMKANATIINTARGSLIDTKALIDALENGSIGAAGLDVIEDENGLYYYNRMGDILDNHDFSILRSFPNVILSPHTAFYTEEDVDDMVRCCFESLEAFALSQRNIYEVHAS